jgi:Protein of unknown function (DUF2726)
MGRVETFLRAYCRRPFLLSKAEKYFYNILREIFGTYTILAKVRLGDLVEADRHHPNWQSNFNSIKSKHIDFIICDAWLCPLLAVELDGSSHEDIDRQQRDALVDGILKDAALEIVHVPRANRYLHKEIRQLLLPKLTSSQLL